MAQEIKGVSTPTVTLAPFDLCPLGANSDTLGVVSAAGQETKKPLESR